MPDANGSPTLNRIERALELLPNYRLQFREEHKVLLAVQAALIDRLNKLAARVDKPVQFGSRTDERLKALAARVKKMNSKGQ